MSRIGLGCTCAARARDSVGYYARVKSRIASACALGLAFCACAESSAIGPLPPLPASAQSAADEACAFSAGADVNLDELFAGRARSQCVGQGWPSKAEVDPELKSALRVEVAPASASVAAGSRLEAVVTLTNAGSAPLTLWFFGELALAPYVFDEKGTRVTPPPEAPPMAAECLRTDDALKHAHLTLAPGGKAHAKVTWEASRVAWRATPNDEDCAAASEAMVTGPLEPGRYTVVVPIPFLQRDRAPAPPRIAVDVRR